MQSVFGKSFASLLFVVAVLVQKMGEKCDILQRRGACCFVNVTVVTDNNCSL
jgi:hypothetical protein